MPYSEHTPHSASSSIAIVGGGLTGLSTAWELLKTSQGTAQITVFEQGDGMSYAPDSGHKRASSGASTARVIRLMGADDVNRQMVRATHELIQEVDSWMNAGERAGKYAHLGKLYAQEGSVYIGTDSEDKGLQKNLRTLQQAGLKEGAGYDVVSGAELKERYHATYRNVPDSAVAVIETPYDPVKNPDGAALTLNAHAFLIVLKDMLQAQGVTVEHGTEVKHLKETQDGVSADIRTGNRKEVVHAIDHMGRPIAFIAKTKGRDETRAFDHIVLATGHKIGELLQGHDSWKPVHHQTQRVIYARLPVESFGPVPEGSKAELHLPFTKASAGVFPAGAEGSSYASEVGQEHLKMLFGSQTSNADTAEDLYRKPDENERQDAIRKFSARYGLPQEAISDKVSLHGCVYTNGPKETPLVDTISEFGHVTVAGLDSSGSARISAGLGRLAAAKALGQTPAIEGYEKFGHAAHEQLHAEVVANEEASITASLSVRQSPTRQHGIS